MIELNMTPLIDVMLVLIIMLIITIPRQNHSINLTLPSASTSKEKPQVFTIDIDFDGTISWEGMELANRAALEHNLLAVAAATTPAELHLRPNKLTPYKAVAGVMAAAQRSGVSNIGVIGNEQL
jgi:biopolymer transport protein ExbD